MGFLWMNWEECEWTRTGWNWTLHLHCPLETTFVSNTCNILVFLHRSQSHTGIEHLQGGQWVRLACGSLRCGPCPQETSLRRHCEMSVKNSRQDVIQCQLRKDGKTWRSWDKIEGHVRDQAPYFYRDIEFVSRRKNMKVTRIFSAYQ